MRLRTLYLHPYLHLLLNLALLLTLALPITAHARAGLATWNLEWLMDQAAHTRWIAACGVVPQSPKEKCRIAPHLADWNAYTVKLRTLKETFRQMDRDGITLVAVQEVFNEDAVRQILPDGWDVITSASLPGAPAIAQHVGLAWKTAAHAPTGFNLLTELSTASRAERPLRPGLQFTLKLEGKPTDFLVVHLKAGCRNVIINKPRRANEQAACQPLAQQVRIVERWIDARAGKDFVILGDFNRTLLTEMAQAPEPDPARFGANPAEAITLMAPEWNDNQPEGSTIRVIPHKRRADGTLLAGDYFCGGTVGIDHIVVSQSLWHRLQPADGALELLPVAYRLDGKRLPVAKTTVPPSDHCARFVRIQ